jgi:putative transposase
MLLRHCSDARYIWNLCIEQESWWSRGRGRAPTWVERGHQLTDARADNPWLAEGSVIVQQQAIRDHHQAMAGFFARTHGYPTWRKAGRNEGFRIVGNRGAGRGCAWDVRRLNRNWGEVRIPKVGWVRFRWSRDAPPEAKSFRVNRDRSGRWHVGFAVMESPQVAGPGTGEIVGIDRGVKVSAALSTGEMLKVPGLNVREQARLLRLQRKLAKAKPGSGRRGKVKIAMARLHARETARRKDWVEKVSTGVARHFDVIRIEALPVQKMMRSAKGTVEKPGKRVRRKAGLNRGISKSGWGLLIKRLEEKAPGRVEKVKPHFTSQRCSACGHVDAKSRESQAAFKCTACGYACNADVNAAKNIAAGHVVTARGGCQLEPLNREPQLLASLGEWSKSPAGEAREDVKDRPSQ